MKNWFAILIDRIQVSASGMLAENFSQTLKCGVFRQFKESNGIDVSVSQEVKKWFDSHFSEWFANLSVMLTEDKSSLNEFSEKINTLIKHLSVARGYYSKQADVAMTTSLKNVAQAKVMLIEELITSLIFSYEQCLKACGIEPNKTIEITNAIDFEGDSPEEYRWKHDKVIVNHTKFENMEDPAQPQNPQACKKGTKDYLPWVITGAFFLIAWGSAVTKPKTK